jgi:hypothetical protein
MPIEKQISKEEAKKKGLKFYYTGLPCKKGHISKIAVRNNECNECKKLWAKIYKKTDKYKNYLKNNKEKLYQGQRSWAKKNSDKVQLYQDKWNFGNHPFYKDYIKQRKDGDTFRKWFSKRFINEKLNDKRETYYKKYRKQNTDQIQFRQDKWNFGEHTIFNEYTAERKEGDTFRKWFKKKFKDQKLNDKRKKYFEIYREQNKDKIQTKARKKIQEYTSSELEIFNKKFNDYHRNWREKNKVKLNKYQSNYFVKYRQKRGSVDSVFKLKIDVRNRLTSFLNSKKITKKNKTFEIIGCTPQELKSHLEKQFKEGMNWSNHSLRGWHIDHIIPLNSGKNDKEIFKLMHYTNLQPLWAEDNLRKKDKILKIEKVKSF